MSVDGQDVARSAARGAAATMLGQALRILVQLVSLSVIARILSVEDYGVVAMALVVTGLADVLRGFGLSNAAIRTASLSAEESDNLFWLSALFGAVLAVAVFALSWPVAALDGDPRVAVALQWLALAFVINGVNSQFQVALLRRLRFSVVATIDVVAAVAGLGAALLAAVLDAGYAALVLQVLVAHLITLVLTVATARWWPGRPHRGVSVRAFLRFGLLISAADVLNYVGRSVDQFVIGASRGPAELGVYNRAVQLVQMPLYQVSYPLSRVVVASVSRFDGDRAGFDALILRASAGVLHLMLPIYVLVAALAEPVVAVVLGPGWGAVAPVLQVLCVVGAGRVLLYTHEWVVVAKGLARSQLLLSSVAALVTVSAVLAVAGLGPVAVAGAVAAVTLAIWAVGALVFARVSDAPLARMSLLAARTVGAYTLAGLGARATVLAVGPDETWLALLVGGAAFVAGVLLLAAVWPALRRDLRGVLRTARALRRR